MASPEAEISEKTAKGKDAGRIDSDSSRCNSGNDCLSAETRVCGRYFCICRSEMTGAGRGEKRFSDCSEKNRNKIIFPRKFNAKGAIEGGDPLC